MAEIPVTWQLWAATNDPPPIYRAQLSLAGDWTLVVPVLPSDDGEKGILAFPGAAFPAALPDTDIPLLGGIGDFQES